MSVRNFGAVTAPLNENTHATPITRQIRTNATTKGIIFRLIYAAFLFNREYADFKTLKMLSCSTSSEGELATKLIIPSSVLNAEMVNLPTFNPCLKLGLWTIL